MLRFSTLWLALLLCVVAIADEAEGPPPRSLYTIGILSPVPSLLGAHLGYQMSGHARIRGSLGASSKNSTLTFGLGLDYLFTPEEEFSPIMGFQLSTRKLYKQDKIANPIGQKYYFSFTTGVELYSSYRTVLTLGVNWVITAPEETSVLSPYLSFGFLF